MSRPITLLLLAVAITDAIQDRIRLGRLPSEPIYGDGAAGPRIAQLLATEPLTIAKAITF